MFRERIILIDVSRVPEDQRHGEHVIRKFPFRIGAVGDPTAFGPQSVQIRNDLSILDTQDPRQVSSAHVEIGFADGRIYVRDLDTSKGTLVNGQRLGKQQPTAYLDQPENEIILGLPSSPWHFRVLVPPDKRPRRLLVVDDDDAVRQLLKRVFAAEYDVIEAANGAAALEVCRTDPPDVVLLDWMMPKLDGIKVCKALKSKLRTAGVPVVLITGYDTASTLAESLEAGADEFLSKTLSQAELRSRVNAVVRRAERARDVHWLTGIASESALRDEVDFLLSGPHGGTGFLLLVLKLERLGKYQREHGFGGVDSLQRDVAEKLWQCTMHYDRSMVAQTMTGRWAMLLPARSGRKVAGFLAGTGRDVVRELREQLGQLLDNSGVRYKIVAVPLDRFANYAEVMAHL